MTLAQLCKATRHRIDPAGSTLAVKFPAPAPVRAQGCRGKWMKRRGLQERHAAEHGAGVGICVYSNLPGDVSIYVPLVREDANAFGYTYNRLGHELRRAGAELDARRHPLPEAWRGDAP